MLAKTFRLTSLMILLLAGWSGMAGAARAQLTFMSGVSLPNGGEIVSFAGGKLLVTNSGTVGTTFHGVEIYTLSSGGVLTTSGSADLASVFGGAENVSSVSSVLADSRGFGVASVIPVATGSTNLGRITFFNTTTGAIINTLDVGFHPDSVSVTPDGTKLLVANEGEYGSTDINTPEAVNRPGSVSVVSLSGVTTAADLSGLSQSSVSTYDFSSGNLGSGVSLTGLRNARLDTPNSKTPNAADIEPEYIAATNDKAYVTLQENNAIAVLNFTTGQFEAIHQLGAITQVIDASDREISSSQGSIGINDTIRGLPMPDTMVMFSRGGTTYLVTANEGDARPDDGDIMRIKDEGGSRPAIDGTVKTTLNSLYSGNFKTDAALGRLNILRDQGDTDADGDIDQPTMMGTRSFSIWNAETGALAFDSASMIEQWVAANDSTSFNINSGLTTEFDKRSDDKGPEPEAVAFGSINGRDYVFVGAERQNGIFQFDITDLANVSIVGYFNPVTSTADSGGAFISPESIQFLAAGGDGNETGKNLLFVGFEGTGGNGSIAVIQAVPEPGTWAMLVAGLGVLAWHRRRRAA